MKTVPTYVAICASIGSAVVAHPVGKALDAVFASLGTVQGAGWTCFAIGLLAMPWLWNSERPRWGLLALVNLMCAGAVLWGVGGGAGQQAGADSTTFTIIFVVMWFASIKGMALVLYAKWELPRDIVERWEREKKLAPA